MLRSSVDFWRAASLSGDQSLCQLFQWIATALGDWSARARSNTTRHHATTDRQNYQLLHAERFASRIPARGLRESSPDELSQSAQDQLMAICDLVQRPPLIHRVQIECDSR